jgi:cell division protein FtsI (penicillin-binding protein 3)
MLMFYNAIANNGRMIKPFIAKQFVKDGKVLKETKAEVVNPMICKETTLQQIHEMLVGVIEEGTAKVVASDYFPVAGKTGTAQIASGGAYGGYYVSFCGYFPADEPMYTIFVGIRKPRGVPSGGGMAGMVFKNIAEQTYIRKVKLTVADCPVDSLLSKEPPLKNGNWRHCRKMLTLLGLPAGETDEPSEWVKVVNDGTAYIPQPLSLNNSLVPDVRGMGARDALYLLEEAGLRVQLNGAGRVVSQSISPGSKLVRGRTIAITLK